MRDARAMALNLHIGIWGSVRGNRVWEARTNELEPTKLDQIREQ